MTPLDPNDIDDRNLLPPPLRDDDGPIEPPEPHLPTEEEDGPGILYAFSDDFVFPFLLLPPELRRTIYRFLFKSSVPLYLTTEMTTMGGVDDPRPRYRRPSLPTAVLRTSRLVHDEAAAVLWGENVFVLQFPRSWGAANLRCGGLPKWMELKEFDHLRALPCPETACRPRETLVPAARYLGQIHHLVVEVYMFRRCGVDSPLHAQCLASDGRRVKRDLEEFVATLVDAKAAPLPSGARGYALETCQVRFRPHAMAWNPNETLATFPTPCFEPRVDDKDDDGEPNEHGCRDSFCCQLGSEYHRNPGGDPDEQVQAQCRPAVEVDQQILEPLALGLSGMVRSASVVGMVSSEWAAFITKCMENPNQAEGESFTHARPVAWGLKAGEATRRFWQDTTPPPPS